MPQDDAAQLAKDLRVQPREKLRMRDPERIDDILDLVRQVWLQDPDLRLGQIIVNAVRPRNACPEIFAFEDTALRRGLARSLESLRQRPRGPDKN